MGLDHNVVFKHLERLDLSHERFDEVFEDVLVMEAEALAVMAQQAADDERARNK